MVARSPTLPAPPRPAPRWRCWAPRQREEGEGGGWSSRSSTGCPRPRRVPSLFGPHQKDTLTKHRNRPCVDRVPPLRDGSHGGPLKRLFRRNGNAMCHCQVEPLPRSVQKGLSGSRRRAAPWRGQQGGLSAQHSRCPGASPPRSLRGGGLQSRTPQGLACVLRAPLRTHGACCGSFLLASAAALRRVCSLPSSPQSCTPAPVARSLLLPGVPHVAWS